MSDQKWTASDLMRLLELRYVIPEWCLVQEVASSTGYGQGSPRFIDALAVNMYPSQGVLKKGEPDPFYPFIAAFEVKVNYQDFVRELTDPSKRTFFEQHCTEFWFVAPKGVIPVSELPEGCGLLETCGDSKLRATRKAVQRRSNRPTSNFWMAVLRRFSERLMEESQAAQRYAEFKGKSISIEDLGRLAEKLGHLRTTRFKGEFAEEWRHQSEGEKKRREEARRRFHHYSQVVDLILKAVRDELGLGWSQRPTPVQVGQWLQGHSLKGLSNLETRLRESADQIRLILGPDHQGEEDA